MYRNKERVKDKKKCKKRYSPIGYTIRAIERSEKRGKREKEDLIERQTPASFLLRHCCVCVL